MTVTAAHGSAILVAANRRRNSFWVEGTGHDGVRRHFQNGVTGCIMQVSCFIDLDWLVEL
jgi:hypothetical protein